jgi:hypothetical protein
MNNILTDLFTSYDAYWNQRDADSYCSLFTTDASAFFFLLNGDKTELNNHGEIHTFYTNSFQNLAGRTGVHHATGIQRVQPVTDAIFIADGEAIITETRDYETTPLRRWAVSFTLVQTSVGLRIASLRACERPNT